MAKGDVRGALSMKKGMRNSNRRMMSTQEMIDVTVGLVGLVRWLGLVRRLDSILALDFGRAMGSSSP